MSALPTFAHCITGRPPTRVLSRGKPLVRFDALQHADGSTWRYEGMGCENRTVVASPIGRPGEMNRFAMKDFDIAVIVELEAPAA